MLEPIGQLLKREREREPSGMGWELFKNYLIAKEKFQPDFFLYENNKSAAQAIKDQIKREFGVYEPSEDGQLDLFSMEEDTGVRYIEINSALVSAQNRQRFYVHNCGDVHQPEDRHILLKDILETGFTDREKGRTILTSAGRTTEREYFNKNQGNMAAERIPDYGIEDKSRPVNALYGANSGTGEGSLENRLFNENPKKQQVDLIAEPLSEKAIVYMSRETKDGRTHWDYGFHNSSDNDTAHCLTAQMWKNVPYNVMCEKVAEPVRVGTYPNEAKNNDTHDSQQYRVYSEDGKSVTLCGNGGGMGAKTGLYAIPVMSVKEATAKGTTEIEPCDCVDLGQISSPTRRGRNMKDKRNCLTTSDAYYQYLGTKQYPVYEVKDGKITIKGKEYPIKLLDGYYIIRKLTVTECCRLQTLPDDFCRAVSDSQAYKGLGNGWTAEVIIHILNGALKDVPRDEEIVVLSMYDGIGTGRYCLDKMGFKNVTYYAYEIDKYAMQISHSNYPDIIQLGDAFQVGNDDWHLPET